MTAIKGFSSLLASSWDNIPEDQRRDQVARTARNAASLGELGYRAAFLFDHRINPPTPSALRVSRLRVDASAGQQRSRAISSGVHSGLFQRVRGG